MPIVTLRDLYVAELQELHDAELQILEELPLMAAQATSAELRQAFDEHLEQTQVHVERLVLLFQQLDTVPNGRCEGIRGLIADSRRRLHEAEKGQVLDAALIGAAQRIEHLEMAGYGCARTYALTLGDEEAARVLQQTLEEEGEADHRLTALAERGINASASADLHENPTTHRSRLRYLAASDMKAFTEKQFRVENRDGDDLGSLDGFIAESGSGRPLYYVIDSGGWFVGRRYVVPVGLLDADETACVLRTDLDRDALARYPEFNPDAFVAMNDEEVASYERRLLQSVAPDLAAAERGGRGPAYDDVPAYAPPTWLMTGVWMTETTGWSSVPPRAESDLRELPRVDREGRTGATRSEQAERTAAASPENELMMARGEEEPPAEPGEREGNGEPRIERYRER